MAKIRHAIMLSLVLSLAKESAQNASSCQDDNKKFRTLRLTVSSRRNQTGDWTDSLTAQTTVGKQSNSSDVDVVHTTEDFQGNRLITIKGVYNGISNALYMTGSNPPPKAYTEETINRRLHFHSKCGKNVILLNGGRTVQKIVPEYTYTTVFTNRPLDNNEIFQVRMEKKNNTGTAVVIGVVGISPEEIDIPSDMVYTTTLYYFAAYHYQNNRLMGKSTENGKLKSTDSIKEGETLGIMRSGDGSLHLFFNGFIQDVPWKDAPSEVYGYFELRGNGYRASIVDP